MIPRQLLASLNLNDSKDVKMAENIWTMLDQMADSSPADYQSFIDKNLKQGFETLKEEKSKKEEPLKVMPEVGFLLRMQAKLVEKSPGSNSDKFKVNDKIEPWQKVRLRFQNQLDIYVNVCYSDRIILPLDKNKNEISQLSTASISKIDSIPYSLQDAVESEDHKQCYFVLVLNDQVYKGLMQLNPPYLINMVCSLLSLRLQSDKNPLLSQYRFDQYPDRAACYQIQKDSIKVDKQIHFKVLMQSKPEKVLLEPGADKQQSRDINKAKPKEGIRFTAAQTKQQIKLPQPKFQSTPSAQPKKVLIQEVQESKEPQNTISYTLVKTDKHYKIEFLVPGISSIRQLELDVNRECIKVNIPIDGRRRQINLDKAIDVDSVKAKYLNKQAKLSVILPYL